MAAKLIIVSSNPKPNRVRFYPRAWLVYKGRKSVFRVLIERDQTKPHVVSKRAA